MLGSVRYNCNLIPSREISLKVAAVLGPSDKRSNEIVVEVHRPRDEGVFKLAINRVTRVVWHLRDPELTDGDGQSRVRVGNCAEIIN